MTETMKPETKQPPKPSRPEAVKVRRLWFVDAMDIPGSRIGMLKTLTAEDPSENKTRYEIEFQPWIRTFRVAHFDPGHRDPAHVRMVPEHRIHCWEPW